MLRPTNKGSRWGQIMKVENDANDMAYNTFCRINLQNGGGRPVEPIRLDGLQIVTALPDYAVSYLRDEKYRYIDDHTANRIFTYRLTAIRRGLQSPPRTLRPQRPPRNKPSMT
jgi:hypothetical protein